MQFNNHDLPLESLDNENGIIQSNETDNSLNTAKSLLSTEHRLSVDDESDSQNTSDSNFLADFLPTDIDAQVLISYADQISYFIRSCAVAAFADDTGDMNEICKGLSFTVLLGILLGLIIPPSETLNTNWYPSVSNILGYTYFVAWSISFYPQIILNYKRKKTEGLSVDLCILVVYGFIAYTAFNCAMFWSENIREEYSQRYHGGDVLVQSNDVAFSVHALIMSSVTLWQIAYYDGFRKRPASMYTIVFVAATFFIGTFYAVFITFIDEGFFTWINFLYLLSYLKIIITCIKYVPQVYLNYCRKSTVGWNVWSVVLDFVGGLLSFLQLILDCWNINDFSGISGDLTKFCLSVLSMSFDIIFLVQHYIMYPSEGENELNLELEENLLIEDRKPEILFL